MQHVVRDRTDARMAAVARDRVRLDRGGRHCRRPRRVRPCRHRRNGRHGADRRVRAAPSARVARERWSAEVGAPELVPLVESGETEGAKARDAVARARAALPGDLDAVVLGVRTIRFLEAHFAGRSVRTSRPAGPCRRAGRPRRTLRNGAGVAEGSAPHRLRYERGDAEHFREQLLRLGVTGLELGDVKHVEEE